MTGLGYTLPAVLAVIAVCALEFGVLRTGLFRRPAYWISMVIVFGFMIPVDGWLTKLSRADRHLRRQPHQRRPVPVRHPRRGFPVRLRAGDRGAAAVGASATARPQDGGTVGSDGLKSAEMPAAFDAGAAAYDGLVDANPGYHRHLGSRPPHAACQRRQGTSPARRGLRHRRVHRGAAFGRPAGRDRRRRRVVGHAGRGRSQALAGICPVRAQPHRGPRRRGCRRTVRRHLCRLPAAQPDDPDAQLREFRTLLRPGATLAVHEYSVSDSRIATAMWNAVCATIIIPMGRLRTGDAGLYRYLRRSVNEFDGAEAFRNRLRANGFDDVRSETDAGLAAQHRAHLPRGSAP